MGNYATLSASRMSIAPGVQTKLSSYQTNSQELIHPGKPKETPNTQTWYLSAEQDPTTKTFLMWSTPTDDSCYVIVKPSSNLWECLSLLVILNFRRGFSASCGQGRSIFSISLIPDSSLPYGGLTNGRNMQTIFSRRFSWPQISERKQ